MGDPLQPVSEVSEEAGGAGEAESEAGVTVERISRGPLLGSEETPSTWFDFDLISSYFLACNVLSLININSEF